MKKNEPSNFEIQDFITRIFRIEEEKSEKIINNARIIIALIYAALGRGIQNQIPAQSLAAIYIISAFTFCYGIFMFFFLRAGKYTPRVKYISSYMDITLLSVAIYFFGTFRSFKTEAFLVYFLWIALAAMRFSVRLTIFTGILGAFTYIIVIALAIFNSTVEFGTITESFTTPKVSLANLIIKIIFMTTLFLIAAYIAKVYRKLVDQSISKDLEVRKKEEEKERVKDTLSRYVSHQVAEKILHEGITLTGEKKNATILFCDIRNFTKMSEDMSPEEVVIFLNEYLTLMIDAIFEYGGTLDKFVGDEIMAVYGVPVSSGNDEEMAVRTALRMKEKLQVLNQERKEVGKDPINFGIGIHSGEVVAGNIGSEKRMEYTVIGQSVNLASRIEALNKEFKTDILITDTVYERVKHFIEIEKQPSISVKGIGKTIQTFRVVKEIPV